MLPLSVYGVAGSVEQGEPAGESVLHGFCTGYVFQHVEDFVRGWIGDVWLNGGGGNEG